MDRIKQFFDDKLVPRQVPVDGTHEIHLAAAALLMEIARADSQIDAQEEAAVIMSLRRAFDLNDDALEETAKLAITATDEAEDFYQFTSLVNEHYRAGEKQALVEDLWRVAWADGAVDKYEAHFIRRISGLIHVPHSQFIQAKQRARPQ
ncbi:MAG: hypothetical protein CMQ24_18105 [Gammaproteobacteria bacterium]|nr:hypothetical protein [Gammaproteobacteria bacterium]